MSSVSLTRCDVCKETTEQSGGGWVRVTVHSGTGIYGANDAKQKHSDLCPDCAKGLVIDGYHLMPDEAKPSGFVQCESVSQRSGKRCTLYSGHGDSHIIPSGDMRPLEMWDKSYLDVDHSETNEELDARVQCRAEGVDSEGDKVVCRLLKSHAENHSSWSHGTSSIVQWIKDVDLSQIPHRDHTLFSKETESETCNHCKTCDGCKNFAHSSKCDGKGRGAKPFLEKIGYVDKVFSCYYCMDCRYVTFNCDPTNTMVCRCSCGKQYLVPWDNWEGSDSSKLGPMNLGVKEDGRIGAHPRVDITQEYLTCEHWYGEGPPLGFCPHCPNGNRNPLYIRP